MSFKGKCVVYLTWGETPRSYGVFGNQVIEQFKCTSSNSHGEFHFISGVPVIHSGMVREKWHYGREIEAIKVRLGAVTFSRIPILAPQNFVNSSSKTFSYFHGPAHVLLAKKLRVVRPSIVHCRSYHAAWAALKVREKYGFDYKIIFDGRDMWPEEMALKNNYRQDSSDYIYLKNVERELLVRCDVSVGVSDEMCSYYKSLGAKHVECIYLSADTDVFSSALNSNKYEADMVNFCYVGALSETGWHKISELHKLYSFLRKSFGKTHLTIVSTSDHASIRKVFSDIPSEEVTLTSSKSKHELMDILATQHFGLMSYFVPNNSLHIALGKILLAIKTVEYLSSGLPMICSRFCGGAARLIEKHHLGLSYCPEKIDLDSQKVLELKNFDSARRCLQFAQNNFDINANAKKYASLYEDLVGRS
ncbi:hypothetical protein TW81_05000 [Vibrio galatheae]|uniref:Glycosyltransferase subfamily 4-like N-terminal domain-containing protein n=1 Tax=Vibrio galatheae TaxID=579748 RepID=A0A0F4NMU3_9VIBR|nr:glycosyltransferase [Vibrio galatheae]KJY84158.1 hypothetical protein TW81_05000 [Vibrio galatheae]